jgi:hypothetical protein
MQQSATPYDISTLKENSPLKRSLESFRRKRSSSVASNTKTISDAVKTPSQFKNNPQTPSKTIHEQERIEEFSVKGIIEKQINDDTFTYPEGRIEPKHSTNPRFFRLIDSAIENFEYKKGQERGLMDERKSESDSLDEANESISEEEFISKKQEINDIKKEIVQKDKARLEQQRKILKLTFDISSLKAIAKDPLTVLV